VIAKLLRLLHGNGLHFWRLSHSTGDRYYVCRVCGARDVRLASPMARPIDHPIDYEWLHSRPVVANVPAADELAETPLAQYLDR